MTNPICYRLALRNCVSLMRKLTWAVYHRQALPLVPLATPWTVRWHLQQWPTVLMFPSLLATLPARQQDLVELQEQAPSSQMVRHLPVSSVFIADTQYRCSPSTSSWSDARLASTSTLTTWNVPTSKPIPLVRRANMSMDG